MSRCVAGCYSTPTGLHKMDKGTTATSQPAAVSSTRLHESRRRVGRRSKTGSSYGGSHFFDQVNPTTVSDIVTSALYTILLYHFRVKAFPGRPPAGLGSRCSVSSALSRNARSES